MIATIKGTISSIFHDSIILENTGIGFQVYIPAPLRTRLKVGEQLALNTAFIVREDSFSLYGFEMQEEKDYFSHLMGVNGIGPRLALTILSNMTPDAIRRAVFQEQVDLLSRVPGVGRKTAQKIVLYLQDRLKSSFDSSIAKTVASDIDLEVMNALIALGYSVVEAQTAIQAIPRDTPTEVETRLRLALQSM